jgi:hypothetical protein
MFGSWCQRNNAHIVLYEKMASFFPLVGRKELLKVYEYRYYD